MTNPNIIGAPNIIGEQIQGLVTSKIGGRRENQDCCGHTESQHGYLLVVCDGMGGGPGGKTASTIATKSIIDYIKNAQVDVATDTAATIEKCKQLLKDAVLFANKALRDAIIQNEELDGMGTTVTALLINKDAAIWAHVGDSRIYQLRKSKLFFRTTDHSRVAELIKANPKEWNEEKARTSPISNLITRALGIGDEVMVDIDVTEYKAGDRFVLCSDGVWGAFYQPHLLKYFSARKSLEGIVEEINMRVELVGNENGGHHDNYSMIIIETHATSIYSTSSDFSDVWGKTKKIILKPSVIAIVITALFAITGAYFLFKAHKTQADNAEVVIAVPEDSVANGTSMRNAMDKINEFIENLDKLKSSERSDNRIRIVEKLSEIRNEIDNHSSILSEREKNYLDSRDSFDINGQKLRGIKQGLENQELIKKNPDEEKFKGETNALKTLAEAFKESLENKLKNLNN